MNNQSPKVGIIIITLNRSEFLIRQLKYYADNNCPHIIYVGDTSTMPEHIEKTRNAIKDLGKKININYYEYPGQIGYHCIYYCLKNVKEKYACFNGDDDYQIPNTLTECAKFLETNPDYATATSLVVNFKLNEPGPYGTIKSLKDYPRPEIHDDIASQRLINFFNNYFVTNISVNRTEQMRKNWETYDYKGLSNTDFGGEIIPCSLSLIDGKAKTINLLGIVRQMHDKQYVLPFVFNWITQKDWFDNYAIFLEILSQRLALKEKITPAEAQKFVEHGFWLYLQKSLIREYPEAFPNSFDKNQNIFKKKLRKKLIKIMPFLKIIYRRYWLSKIKKRIQLHYEVLRPDSPYYKDFKPVMDSFTPTPNKD